MGHLIWASNNRWRKRWWFTISVSLIAHEARTVFESHANIFIYWKIVLIYEEFDIQASCHIWNNKIKMHIKLKFKKPKLTFYRNCYCRKSDACECEQRFDSNSNAVTKGVSLIKMGSNWKLDLARQLHVLTLFKHHHAENSRRNTGDLRCKLQPWYMYERHCHRINISCSLFHFFQFQHECILSFARQLTLNSKSGLSEHKCL